MLMTDVCSLETLEATEAMRIATTKLPELCAVEVDDLGVQPTVRAAVVAEAGAILTYFPTHYVFRANEEEFGGRRVWTQLSVCDGVTQARLHQMHCLEMYRISAGSTAFPNLRIAGDPDIRAPNALGHLVRQASSSIYANVELCQVSDDARDASDRYAPFALIARRRILIGEELCVEHGWSFLNSPRVYVGALLRDVRFCADDFYTAFRRQFNESLTSGYCVSMERHQDECHLFWTDLFPRDTSDMHAFLASFIRPTSIKRVLVHNY